MRERKPSYTPAPAVPPKLMLRLAAIVAVLAGAKTVSQAARELSLSRNHFQTILHRGVLALVQSITPKRAGRPGKNPTVAALEGQLLKLKRENHRLQRRVEAAERLLQVAGSLLHGRLRPTGRQRRSRRSGASRGERSEDNDTESRGRQSVLEGIEQMRHLGLTAAAAATIAGVNASTVRRWRVEAERPCVPSRIRKADVAEKPVSASAIASAEQLVRRLHGLIGAEALRHSVPGLSRRRAASVKAQTLTAMERERKAALVRVRICYPGVLRGMDAMYLRTKEGGTLFALISADGAVPYRTSVLLGQRYDAELVARALSADFERDGAPLIARLDRASVHAAPLVQAVLDAHAVLLLHGPPRYPCFYGQLERQNREHRAWLQALGELPAADAESCLREMLDSVNNLWSRRTLNWKTAAEIWNARPRLVFDRNAFREEVTERTARIARKLTHRGSPADLPERLAIEQTLTKWGYVIQRSGGWC